MEKSVEKYQKNLKEKIIKEFNMDENSNLGDVTKFLNTSLIQYETSVERKRLNLSLVEVGPKQRSKENMNFMKAG
jgi:hypothetical protein